MKAWYFSNKGCTLGYGDNRPIAKGVIHTVDTKPVVCESGLHGSVRLIDALRYAPGPYCWQVDITGSLDKQGDKLCGANREYLAGFDATEVLRKFARQQALINIDKIKTYTEEYDVIYKYLITGDSSLRSAAWSAAWSAARSAESAAWSAQSAARSAAWSAAWSAARSAESAAWSAAWSAQSAARSAARSAAWSAAWSAAESEANDMLTTMVEEELK